MTANGRMIEVDANGRVASGYLTEALNSNKAALLVVQEWWGLNDHIKNVADRFAGEGYTALAPDLYDGRVATTDTEAGRLMQGLDQNRAIETLNAAVDYLKRMPAVDGKRIGIVGFCMGGTFALLLPCLNKEIQAAVPFYGDVPNDETLKNLSAPVLFIGTDNDPWITMDKIERLKSALERFGKEGEVAIYKGAGHAFFNDTRPGIYKKEEAEDAWRKVLDFLSKKL
jgi:carboxymethylenebutenolidase